MHQHICWFAIVAIVIIAVNVMMTMMNDDDDDGQSTSVDHRLSIWSLGCWLSEHLSVSAVQWMSSGNGQLQMSSRMDWPGVQEP